MKIAAAAAPLFRIDANATTRIGAPLTLKRCESRDRLRAARFFARWRAWTGEMRQNGITAVDNAMTLT